MKAVIEQNTRRVVFLFPSSAEVVLGERGLMRPVRALDINSSNAFVLEVSDPPADYVNGLYAWVDGTWQVYDQPRLTELQQQAAARAAEEQRREAIEDTIRQDTVVAQLKGMTAAEFDTWWSANITNLAQALGLLKRLTRIVIRRVL